MKTILFLLFAGWYALPAQTQEVSITAKGTYTTGTRFLYNVDRPQSYDNGRVLSSNFGYGADIRWKVLWERFYLGVSFEKIEGTETFQMYVPELDYLLVPYEEGFQLTAIEISGFYVVPISSEKVQFYLGGGFGLYDGDRSNSIASATSATTGTTSNIGMHVLTGIDYRVAPHVAVRGELKFRDPHFNVRTKFDQPSVEYQGKLVSLPDESTTTVNLYGVNYMLGLEFQL